MTRSGLLLRVLAVFLLTAGLTTRMWPAPLPPAAISVHYDLQEARAPVVVMLGGSEGGRFAADHPMTQALNGAGFSVAQVAYFGLPGLPAQLDRIALDPFDEMIAALAGDPAVDARCIFVVGASKGGELALLLAADNPMISAVAALVPAHVVFQSSKVSLRKHSSWRRGDQPLPFVRYPTLNPATWRGVLGLEGYRAMHEAALARSGAVTAALIPVERIAAPIYLAYADDDHVWPSRMMVDQIAARLVESGSAIVPEVYNTGGSHFVLNNRLARRDLRRFLVQTAVARGCLPQRD